jgi:hypothetical protein
MGGVWPAADIWGHWQIEAEISSVKLSFPQADGLSLDTAIRRRFVSFQLLSPLYDL